MKPLMVGEIKNDDMALSGLKSKDLFSIFKIDLNRNLIIMNKHIRYLWNNIKLNIESLYRLVNINNNNIM